MPLPLHGAVVALFVLALSRGTQAESSPEALVAQLSTSRAAAPDRTAEDRVVALGDRALPALEQAMRFGLRGQESQTFTDSGTSRRWAVVRVLARIPSAGATDLLVRALADHPDTLGMRHATLSAVEARDLTVAQLRALLLGTEPNVVLLGLRKAGRIAADSALAEPARTLYESDRAREQLRNEYGFRNANDDVLWDVRLAAGNALGIDMVPEQRRRAWTLVGELEAAVTARREDASAAFATDVSVDELAMLRAMGLLVGLGVPARDVVSKAADSATGDFRAVLDMTLLGLGDADRWESVANSLTDSTSPSLRVVAALALVWAKESRAAPALWRALDDPFQRVSGCCVRMGDGMVFPVRLAAANALETLGADAATVNARARGVPPKLRTGVTGNRSRSS
jgi:HEAT repeat protein